MVRLSANQRKKVPKSEMGLPGKATKKGGAVSGSYPMPDKKHAALAKSLAAQHASPAQRKTIDAKANKVLGKSRPSNGGAGSGGGSGNGGNTANGRKPMKKKVR